MSTTDVLGVSHLAFGVREFAPAESVLGRFGYSVSGHVSDGEHSPERMFFARNPSGRRYSMKLLVAGPGVSPIELIREHTNLGVRDSDRFVRFEIAWLPKADLEAADFRPPSSATDGDVPGIRVPIPAQPAGTSQAILVYCRRLEECLPLWHALGFDVRRQFGAATVHVRGPRSGQSTSVFLIETGLDYPQSALDQTGIVCLSFLCKDVRRLRQRLVARDVTAGECFTLAPLGRSLTIFFVRNATGEIYEFLSRN